MRKIKLQILGSGAILASIVLTAACGGQESGGVVNSTNANRSNNPNTATVVNANNSNTGIISSTNSNAGNANRWANANSVTREEYDKNRAQYEAEKGASTIGQGANDSWLWFKTRAALLTTEDLRESTVNVDVENDVVTLRGTVETQAQKTKAEQVAKGIQGVKSVKNELKVAPGDSMANMGGGNANNRSGNANTNRK
jgi:hyperosmotically inducible periplasmic protein